MDAEELKRAHEIFEMLDKQHSDCIHVQELGKALRGMGLAPSETHVRDFTEKCDKDPNNCLTIEEFRKIYKECKTIAAFNNDDVVQQIRRLDPRNTGVITASELKELLITGDEPLTPYEADLIIADFCNSSTESINLNQFIDALINIKY
jgi:Ca2+-binding EF-hand superfamily protein